MSDSTIKKFQNQVSWLDSFHQINKDKLEWRKESLLFCYDAYICKAEDGGIFYAICCPSEGFEKCVELIEEIFRHSKPTKEKYWLIIDGFVEGDRLEKFLFEKHQGIIPWFLDPVTTINYNRFIQRVLDGIDWQASLETGEFTTQWEEK